MQQIADSADEARAPPADLDPPAQTAYRRQVDRQDQEADRDHPEAQHRQEAQQPADNEGDSQHDADSRGRRQADPALPEADVIAAGDRQVPFR